jgi:hypothetical protein
MSDYGIRVSKDGEDVRICGDQKTFLTSKYYFFKGSSLITGSHTMAGGGNRIETVTVAHNLGYVPFYQARCTGIYRGYMNVPCGDFEMGMPAQIDITCTADNTNFYLKFDQTDELSIWGANTFYYIFIIYIDSIT